MALTLCMHSLRVATKEKEEIKKTTKLANFIEDGQDDVAKKEGTTWNRRAFDRRQWKTLMKGYILHGG